MSTRTGLLARGLALAASAAAATYLVFAGVVAPAPATAASSPAAPTPIIRVALPNTPEGRSVWIEVALTNAVAHCSGFMVGPHTVATAGHCLKFSPADGVVKRITLVPGQTKTSTGALSRPYGTCTGGGWATPYSATSANYSNDYAYIQMVSCFNSQGQKISRDVGTRVGYFALSAVTTSSLVGRAVSYRGYPAMHPSAYTGRDGAMYGFDAYGRSDTNVGIIGLTKDCAGGGSGGLVYQRSSSGQYLARGIMSYSARDVYMTNRTGHFRMLDSTVVAFLKRGVAAK